jgi:hypothetical protein
MSKSGPLLSNQRSLHPSDFLVEEIEFFNHKGDSKIISDIVASVNIRESIYLPSLICEISIGDAVNFLQAFEIIGQEKIRIVFAQHPIYQEEANRIELEFIITEYPRYERYSESQNQQAFILRGISEFAHNSKYIKISRSYTSSSTIQIEKIVRNDLFYDNISVNGEDATTHSGIINIQEPLSAIEYLRKSAYDEFGAPFFFYQTLSGQVQLSSVTYLTDKLRNPLYSSYSYLKGFVTQPSTAEYYEENRLRILRCSSNLELSKAFQSAQGAYASKNQFLDIATKQFTPRIYNYLDKSSKKLRETNIENAPSRSVLSNTFTVGRDNANVINALPDAHHEYLSTNSAAFPNGINYTDDLSNEIDKMNAYGAIMRTITQQIRLNGDFNLNAGKKIKLLFPKAMDPDVYKTFNQDDIQPEHLDTLLSGNHLISSVIHEFDMTGDTNSYHCELELVKDTLVFNPSTES